MSAEASLHATCVVVDEAGILVRGPSGSGKSSVALALVEHATRSGRFARLVGDDRVRVEARAGRLVARGPAATAGLIERRGQGLVRMAHEPAAVLRLIVDCVAEPARMPAVEDARVDLLGVELPRLFHRIESDPSRVVTAVLSALRDTVAPE